MKINKLKIENFKGVNNLSVIPGQFTAFVGKNGSGKTSVLEALRSAINGKTPSEHISVGKVYTQLSLDVDRLGVIERFWQRGKAVKNTLNHRNTTQKSIGTSLQSLYGFNPSTVDIMSSGEVVEQMLGADFAKYILSFVKNDMDIDKLCALCGLSADAEAELRMCLPAAPDVITLEDIAEAYQNYYDCRAGAKAVYEAESGKAKYTGIVPKNSSKKIMDDIASVSKQAGAISAAVVAYKDSKKAAEANAAQIKSLEEQIAKLPAKKPSPVELKSLQEQLKILKELDKTLSAEIVSHRDGIARTKKILAALDSSVCPISNKLVCTTDKTSVRGELEAYAAELEEKIKVAEESQKGTLAKISSAEESIENLKRKAAEYSTKLALIEQLEAAKSVKLTVREKPDDSALPRLEAAMSALNKELSLATAYEAAKEAERKAAAAKIQYDIYAELVTLLSPKGGARQKVLEHNLAPLEAYINKKGVSVLPKYTIRLDATDGFNVLFVDSDGNVIPFDNLSTGERIRAVYLLTDMLNALNGYRILIVDNLDGLDSEALNDLLNVIIDNADDYDHVFVATIDKADDIDILSKSPFDIYRL